MGCSRYVGRVGALAVALGVGTAAVTWPGVAVADTEQQTPSDPVGAVSPNADPVSDPTPSVPAPGAVAGGSGNDGPAGGGAAAGDGPAVVTSGSTSITTELAPGVTLSVSGGPHREKEPEPVVDEPVVVEPIAEPEPELAPLVVDDPGPVVVPVAEKGAQTSKGAPDPVPAPVVVPVMGSAVTGNVVATLSTPSIASALPPAFGRSARVQNLSTAAGVATGTPSTATVGPAAVTAASVSPPVDPIAALLTPVASLAGALLSFVGLLPSLVTGPTAPTEPPLLWVVLAWTRRIITETFDNQTPTLSQSPITTSQSTTGVVTGTVVATDAENDPLRYRVVGGAAKGQVSIDPVTGVFTYTPGTALLAQGGSDTFTFAAPEANAMAHFHGGGAGILASLFGGDRGDTAVAMITVNVAALQAQNAAPIAAAAPSVGSPNANGVITGLLNVTDADHDPLTYRLADGEGPAYGSVDFNASTGTYTYTPDPAARLAATLTTGTVEKDDFVVEVSDPTHAPVRVTVSNLLVTELPANSVIATVDVGNGPGAIVYGADGTSYVANEADGTVTVVGAAAGANPVAYDVGSRPVAIVLNSTGTLLYVATAGDRKIVSLNTATYAVSDVAQLDAEPTGIEITSDDALLYVSNAKTLATDSTISVITVATGAVATLPIDPFGLVTTSNGNYIYAVNQNAGTIVVVARQGDGYAVVDNLPVGGTPSGIALSPDENYLYVTNTDADRVTVIALANGNSTSTIDVGDQPRGVVVTPDGTHLYVANFGDDTVSVVDLANGNAVTTVRVGDGPYGIAVNAAGTQVTVTNSLSGSVTTLLLLGNGSPTVTPTVTSPDPLTGVVVGHINPVDPDGDPLAYVVTTDATFGTVTIDPTGQFTYTPFTSARQLAASTSGADFDTFAITVDDGHGAQIVVPVTAEIAPVGVVGRTTIAGLPGDGIRVSPDGTRAIEVTYAGINSSQTAPRVTVIDTSTGARVGDTFTFNAPGSNAYIAFAPQGSRASVVTQTYDSATNSGTSYLTIIDTADGTQVGSTVVVAGFPYRPAVFNGDGTRSFLVTQTAPNNVATTHVAVVDAQTGSMLGVTDVAGALVGGLTFSPDGVRAYQATSESVSTGDPNNPWVAATRIVAIDAATGVQVGDTLQVLGGSGSGLQFIPGSDRAFQTTVTYDSANGTQTRVVLVDTVALTTIGDPVVVAGGSGVTYGAAGESYGVVVSPNGSYAVLPTSASNATSVVVIDASTNTVVGGTTSVGGQARNILFTPDGAHAVIVTSTPGGFGDDGNIRVATIDVATGARVGDTVTVPGSLRREVVLSADGTRAVVVSTASSSGVATQVRVIDTATGALVGPVSSASGYETGVVVTADGRALVSVPAYGSATSNLLVVDLADGTSNVVALGTGYASNGLTLAGDGSRGYVALSVNDEATQSVTTQFVVVDLTADPVVVGSLALVGAAGPVALTPDGSRALVAIRNGGPNLPDFTTTVTTIAPGTLV